MCTPAAKRPQPSFIRVRSYGTQMELSTLARGEFLALERERGAPSHKEVTSKASETSEHLGSKQKSDAGGCTVIAWFL